ncbi:uncharacterized protein HD556DRAFT_55793 [Suillus plorans]|uniref:Uncharacterized protein n=1 Tax=Suillus plorans TaxID=116603 RepID=A0A9P7E4C4_9AGAM|nr:uncharacterized protein HD556DRAFT_55793 [Suillus plorans]KAG1810474.1 hypothetical protein HD556DRAFT_55793 [Suillus plorans]
MTWQPNNTGPTHVAISPRFSSFELSPALNLPEPCLLSVPSALIVSYNVQAMVNSYGWSIFPNAHVLHHYRTTQFPCNGSLLPRDTNQISPRRSTRILANPYQCPTAAHKSSLVLDKSVDSALDIACCHSELASYSLTCGFSTFLFLQMGLQYGSQRMSLHSVLTFVVYISSSPRAFKFRWQAIVYKLLRHLTIFKRSFVILATISPHEWYASLGLSVLHDAYTMI